MGNLVLLKCDEQRPPKLSLVPETICAVVTIVLLRVSLISRQAFSRTLWLHLR